MTEPHPPPGGWRTATVVEVDHSSPHAVRLRLDVPDRVAHLPGQHFVVRLTAEDGYTATRSYSVASDPGDDLIELWVERLEDGEVSTFLADVIEVGEPLQVRGPIGGYFVWSGKQAALAVGAGSGVVPLMSMLRHAQRTGREDRLRLAVSARTYADLPYAAAFEAAGARITLSRGAFGERMAGRLVAADLADSVAPGLRVYVCGSPGFAEAASQLVVTLGANPADVRVERFGPTGS